MTTVSRTFTVGPAPDVVVPYLADFGHAEQWDPGTERCTRNDDGPVRVGSSWHNTSKIAGTETIDVVPDGSGSRLTYTNDLEFKGVAKLAAPLGRVVFEKLGNDTERQLTDVLNGLGR